MQALHTKEEKESKLIASILLVTKWGAKSYTEKGIQLKIKYIHWLIKAEMFVKSNLGI